MNTAQFLFYWIAFTGMILVAAGVAALWAWRAGHFSRQERARYLALWAEVPEDKAETEEEKDARLRNLQT